MKVRFLSLVAVMALCVGIISADDKKASPPDKQKMMEAMMKHATPGDAHKIFEKQVGKWTYVGKMYMDPSAPPMEMTGTAERKLLMDGRFLADHIKGNPPMPFEGMGWWGYDNQKKKYWYTWIDSMSTAYMSAEGVYDPATKSITMNSECFDPMEGKVVKGKDVTHFKSADEVVQTFYKLADGKEIKSMEITSKRVK